MVTDYKASNGSLASIKKKKILLKKNRIKKSLIPVPVTRSKRFSLINLSTSSKLNVKNSFKNISKIYCREKGKKRREWKKEIESESGSNQKSNNSDNLKQNILLKISSTSWTELQSIVSKKVRDYQQKQPYKLCFDTNISSTEDPQKNSAENNILLSESESTISANIKLKCESSCEFSKSLVPVSTFSSASLDNTLNTLPPCFTSNKSKPLVRKIPTLSTYTSNVIAFVPEPGANNISSPTSFIEKNKENIKKLQLAYKESEETSKDKIRLKKRPTRPVKIGNGIKNRKSNEQASKRPPVVNRNVCSYYFTNVNSNEDANYGSSQFFHDLIRTIDCVVRFIYEILKRNFPGVFTEIKKVDKGTNTHKVTKQDKFKSKVKYLPPWESYKNFTKLDKQPLEEKSNTPTSQVVSKYSELIEANLISHAALIPEKCQSCESKIIDSVSQTENLAVPVTVKKSISQQCSLATDKCECTFKPRKSWKVKHPKSSQKQPFNPFSYLMALSGLFARTSSKNLRFSAPNSHSCTSMKNNSSVSMYHHLKRKHTGAENPSFFDETVQLPQLENVRDKKLIYSYLANSMAHSSTSFLCPMLSNDITSITGSNASRTKSKLKRLKKKTALHRNYDCSSHRTASSMSVPDIYYEASDYDTAARDISISTNPERNLVHEDCLLNEPGVSHTQKNTNFQPIPADISLQPKKSSYCSCCVHDDDKSFQKQSRVSGDTGKSIDELIFLLKEEFSDGDTNMPMLNRDCQYK